MKCLLVVIVSYIILNIPVQAQSLSNTKDQEVEGVVRIDKTIAEEKKTSVGQQRIAYVKAKSIEQRAALAITVREGKIVVTKAKEKIFLAKKKLEHDRVKNNISDQEYIARKARLKMIEKKVQDLDDNLLRN